MLKRNRGPLPEEGKMLRILVLTAAVVLGTAAAALAQFPPQPAPPASPFGGSTEAERVACRPDVVKYCEAEVKANEQDIFGILNCLQRNRSRISPACSNVLRSHNQ